MFTSIPCFCISSHLSGYIESNPFLITCEFLTKLLLTV